MFLNKLYNKYELFKMVKYKRCSEYVFDRNKKIRRKCKNRITNNKTYCSIHKEDDPFKNWRMGLCCFCLEECNPASQSCGRCARMLH